MLALLYSMLTIVDLDHGATQVYWTTQAQAFYNYYYMMSNGTRDCGRTQALSGAWERAAAK